MIFVCIIFQYIEEKLFNLTFRISPDAFFQGIVTINFYSWEKRSSWQWSYGSWIYNYLCNQCLSPLMLWVLILNRARCTTCDKVCQWLATSQWFSSYPLVSSTNKTDCHDITEILLKVALNTIKQTNKKLRNKVYIEFKFLWFWLYDNSNYRFTVLLSFFNTLELNSNG